MFSLSDVRPRYHNRGATLIELLLVAAILGLFFVGIMGGVQAMLQMIGIVRGEAGAVALATERIEYIRSIPYYDLGTVSGIPSGTIAQTATYTLNGVEYTETVDIRFIDRPQDGEQALGTDPLGEDSKRIIVTMSWNTRGVTDSLTMQTDVIPPGLETTSGGGVLLVNVFDKAVQPVPLADVAVYNATGGINVTYQTDVNGQLMVPGVPAGSGYELLATRPGYSIDQTYSASATNPLPARPHISVSEGVVSTLNFQIDELGDLIVNTIGQPTKSTFSDTFAGTALIGTSTDVSIGGGEVVLDGGPSSYEAVGTVFATTTEPSTIDTWESFDFNATTSADTSLVVQVYEVSGSAPAVTFTLIPDSVLPFNSIGFSSGPVNITAIDPGTYPRLALGATLSTTDASETPVLYDWSLTHIESEVPVGNVDFRLTGAKTIGTNGGNPVYKYQQDHSTNGSGSVTIPDLEFDGYSFVLTGGTYAITEIIGGDPFEKEPGVTDEVTLVLNSAAAASLRLTVNDIDNDPIGGADARLSAGGYDVTQETSIYGQTYYSGGGLSDGLYQLDVTAAGYEALNVPDVNVSGITELVVQLVAEGAGGGPGGGPGTTTPPAPSDYLAGYNSRVPLSISGGALFGSVSNFPVYVDLSDLPGSFFSSVQADGDDIRVTAADGLSEVPYELVSINTGAGTGELHFRAANLDISTTTQFYIYFGSSTASGYAASDPYGSDNVWSNGFQAVYHFEEAAAGTGNSNVYQDSSGNNYDGDDYIAATGKTGRMGAGQEFDGNSFNDYISLPRETIRNLTDITVSAWFSSTDTSKDFHPILSGAHSGQSNEYLFWLDHAQNEVELFSHSVSGVEVFDIADVYDGAWRQFTMVKNDATGNAHFYLNGAEDNQSPDPDIVDPLDIDIGGVIVGQEQDCVGGCFQSNQEMVGFLDELRISSVARSTGWIANEYANQNNPSGFYAIGSVESY